MTRVNWWLVIPGLACIWAGGFILSAGIGIAMTKRKQAREVHPWSS